MIEALSLFFTIVVVLVVLLIVREVWGWFWRRFTGAEYCAACRHPRSWHRYDVGACVECWHCSEFRTHGD